ncbi:ABC transporter substrate-binding protein [Actinomyces bowdenii]|uniref:ABC transporter substrate-binding protein n=1 Tax=Actinomyces bowdenii TaxID=131109 RepID=A0A3P1V8P0_9ACTO|nr:ABC transporter substrate-binding protein [Actinomyces bowdenii]MBO3724744.1 ABC transporter substrate-binding protein [Actinomyces bowdenii]RRD29735.1 ABC transporter substrate-binding protein [Actinomyces bowdenii]
MAINTPAGSSRRDFLRLTGTLGAAAGLVAGLAACGGGQGPSASRSGGASSAPTEQEVTSKDGVITAGISYELGTNGYDPMTTSAALTVAANWHTLEGLTELHPATREVYAALGAELPAMVDDTTYEVALREGAMFSDGTAVTTEDVVFSFERVLDPANKSLYSQFLTFLDKVEAKDGTTVTIKLKHAFSLVAERLSVVKIVPKAKVEADAKAFDLMPVGTGPYTMTDNGAATQKVVFERNDKYNGPRPALAKSMTWQILPDDTTRTNAITSSAVQAIDAVPAANLSTMKAPVTVAAEQGFGLLFAMFNHTRMSDVKARQAVMHALDYAKICETGMAGLATPATCFVQEGHPAYKKVSTVYSLNAEKAKSLLSEAGITSLNLLCTDHGWFSSVRPIIRENLEALGITVAYTEKKSSEAYSFIDSGEGDWDVLIAPGDPSVFGNDADLLMRWWYGADLWTETRMHWKGAEGYTAVQSALDEAVKLEGDAQIAKWQEIFETLATEVPLYPIFHRKSPTAYNSETLQNFKPIKLTGLSFVGTGSTAS